MGSQTFAASIYDAGAGITMARWSRNPDLISFVGGRGNTTATCEGLGREDVDPAVVCRTNARVCCDVPW